MVERSNTLDHAYGALAHPVRREILRRLRNGSGTVTEIAEPFEMSLAGVSKHIRVLEEGRLLRRTVVGREHHLALDPVPLKAASAWLEEYRAFWEGRLDALDSFLRRGR
jgi:DNA-binding transcriptional ArsR family regulator